MAKAGNGSKDFGFRGVKRFRFHKGQGRQPQFTAFSLQFAVCSLTRVGRQLSKRKQRLPADAVAGASDRCHVNGRIHLGTSERGAVRFTNIFNIQKERTKLVKSIKNHETLLKIKSFSDFKDVFR